MKTICFSLTSEDVSPVPTLCSRPLRYRYMRVQPTCFCRRRLSGLSMLHGLSSKKVQVYICITTCNIFPQTVLLYTLTTYYQCRLALQVAGLQKIHCKA